MPGAIIVIEGLGALERNLKIADKQIYNALRVGLRQAAEPVKRDADRLSLKDLSGMKRARGSPPPWSVQKIGQTQSEVYIVPTERGKRYYRTPGDRRRAVKFSELMLGRAYEPAFERNRVQVKETVDYYIGSVARTL